MSVEIVSIGVDRREHAEEVREAHTELSRFSEQAIFEHTERARRSVPIDGEKVLIGQIIPRGRDYDETRPIILPLPFMNGITPSMVLRGMMLQKSIEGGIRPVIMLPNNMVDDRAYKLNTDQPDQKIFDLLSGKQAKAIDAVAGTNAEHDIIAYSQGAALAPWLASRLAVDTVVSADAPNTFPHRSAKELKKAFTGKGFEGLRDLNGAIMDAEFESLRILQGVHPSGRVSVRQILGLANVLRSSLIAENKALHDAMSGGSHEEDLIRLRNVHPAVKLVVARAAKSTVLPTEEFANLIEAVDPDAAVILEGRGHGAADNITQFAALGHFALSK